MLFFSIGALLLIPAVGGSQESETLIDEMQERARNIVIPKIDFEEVPLPDAVTELEEQARVQDPENAEFSIAIEESVREELGINTITLRLSNVPLTEALRYTTNLAGATYRFTKTGVEVVSLTPPDKELHTNQYAVPPTFNLPPANDPFAATPASDALTPRPSARQVLEQAGISFPPGSSAIFNPSTSMLIVRNSTDQLELVEAYIESIRGDVEKQIQLTTRFVISREPVFDDLDRTEPAEADGFSRHYENSEEMIELLFSRELPKMVERRHLLDERRLSKGTEDQVVAGVFNPVQLEALLEDIGEKPGSRVENPLPQFVLSGRGGALMSVRRAALGVTAVLGADNQTVDLILYPRYLEDPPELLKPRSIQLVIWDQQTVFLSGKLDRETYLAIGITATISDPAGNPINSSPDSDEEPITDED